MLTRGCHLQERSYDSGGGQQFTKTARTFQAVREKVLPAEPILSVRSAMPGSDRMDRCSQPSNTRCSYTANRRVFSFEIHIKRGSKK